MVAILAEGSHVEINATVTQTRLYQNLIDVVRCMGYYDVKNAKLCNVYHGEGLTHREPVVDEADFSRFVATIEPLLQPNRDVLWVMAGRTESNLPKIRKVLAKHKMHAEVFYLCYNAKQMQQFGYWRRQRGVARSKSIEQALFVYKGKVPRNLPKTRKFVDGGSAVFSSVVRNVPLLPPKSQAWVSKPQRDQSLASMVGTPHDEDAEEQEKAQLLHHDDEDWAEEPAGSAKQEDIGHLFAQKRKRKLYRQVTGTDPPWFPHDNASELLQELCWEAGSPRWVFHGTPAGGAGINGCLEAGCSVVALCFDEHHRSLMKQFVLERAVEATARGTTMVFKDTALQTRASSLLSIPQKPSAEAVRSVDPPKPSEEDEEEKPPKKTKRTEKKQKKKVESSSSESAEGEDGDDAEERAKKKRKRN